MYIALQGAEQVAALRDEIHQVEKRVEEAQAHACATEDRFAAWRHVQADLVHALPQSPNGKGSSKMTAKLGGVVPDHDTLRFSKGPQSPLAAFQRSLQQKESPLDIFAEVYAGRKPRTAPAAPSSIGVQHLRAVASPAEQSFTQPEVSGRDRAATARLLAQLGAALQTLKDVSDLAKYYARSVHLGYQRVTKQFLARRSLPSQASAQLDLLADIWTRKSVRHLDSVAVR